MRRKWLVLGLGLSVLIGLSLAGLGWWFIMRGIPSIKELREMQPTRLSKVIAADGQVIGWFPPDGMVVLAHPEIPEMMKKAFIAAEDALL